MRVKFYKKSHKQDLKFSVMCRNKILQENQEPLSCVLIQHKLAYKAHNDLKPYLSNLGANGICEYEKSTTVYLSSFILQNYKMNILLIVHTFTLPITNSKHTYFIIE